MSAILDRANKDGRDLSVRETEQFDELEIEAKKLAANGNSNGSNGNGEFRTVHPFGEGRDLLGAFRGAGWEPGESASLDWPEFRAVTWTGSVDGVAMFQRDAGDFGADQRYAWPAFQQTSIEPDVTSVQVLTQTARTLPTAANVVRAIDAVTNKPEAASTLTLNAVPVKQVAAVQSGLPNVLLETEAISSVVGVDLRLSINEGLDKLILDAIAASGFQAPSTDPLLVSIRKAMTTIFAVGYNPNLLILTPAMAETLDTDQSLGTEKFWTFGAGNFAPRELFGMQVRVSKTIPASAVVDSQALGRLYVGPISLATFEENAGKTNTSLVRMEGHAAFGTERQNAAVRIAAA